MEILQVNQNNEYVQNIIKRATSSFEFYISVKYKTTPDPKRVEDWGLVCALIRLTAETSPKETGFSWEKEYKFPSGNISNLKNFVNQYEEGWQLLDDLGLYDPITEEDFVEEIE